MIASVWKSSKKGVSSGIDLSKKAFSGWSDDNVPRLGAALAYYTVFSLAPLLIITIAVAGLAFGQTATQSKIVDTFHGLLGAQGAEAIQYLLKTASRPGTGVAATVVGVITILIGATGVFADIQSALNQIWGVRALPGRTIRTALRQRFLSAAMIMGIAFLLLVSLLVTTALTAVGNFLSDALPGGVFVWHVANFGVSLAVTAVLFGAIFKVLPDVHIEWRDTVVGALITAVLFTVGKLAIGLYLGNSGASVYGAASSLLVLLVWVYYSAQIFLIGVEYTKAYAVKRGIKITAKSGAEVIPAQNGELASVHPLEARKAG
jgi:membrane protein